MTYSYQDCWNYAFSLKKSEPEAELTRDLISICQTSPEEFWGYFTHKFLTESEYASFCQKIVKYYEENYPAPYLNQRVSFYQLFFSTKKGVFIPQKDTERLIEKLLELAEKKWSKKKLRVLDIGTGCGNIVVSLAKIKPDWQFVATDINPQALELAKKNAFLHQTKNIDFVPSDLFANLDPCQKFDLIVANPPYVSLVEYQKLSSRTKKQPQNALLATENGYFFYRQIFSHSPNFLRKKFLLLVEIGRQKKEKLLELAKKYFPSAHSEFFLDYADQLRVMAIYNK